MKLGDPNWILPGKNTVQWQGSVNIILGLLDLQKVENFLGS
jgi:hypothetical protein